MSTEHPSHQDFEDELRSLLFEGRKIEAVKLYRARTGAGLKDAADAINALEQGESLPQSASASSSNQPAESSVEWDIIPLLENGQKIQAIKVYRERTGVGLKKAKDAVERIIAERGITAAQGSGCLGVLVLTLGVIISRSLAPSSS